MQKKFVLILNITSSEINQNFISYKIKDLGDNRFYVGLFWFGMFWGRFVLLFRTSLNYGENTPFN